MVRPYLRLWGRPSAPHDRPPVGMSGASRQALISLSRSESVFLNQSSAVAEGSCAVSAPPHERCGDRRRRCGPGHGTPQPLASREPGWLNRASRPVRRMLRWARGSRAVSSVGRASRLHREGRRFEPVTAHQFHRFRPHPFPGVRATFGFSPTNTRCRVSPTTAKGGFLLLQAMPKVRSHPVKIGALGGAFT